MSVLDELAGLQDKLRSRMQELRPLVDEYAELEKAAQRLDSASEAVRTAEGKARQSGRNRRSSARASRAPKTLKAAEAGAPVPDAVPEVKPGRPSVRSKSKMPVAAATAQKRRAPRGSRGGGGRAAQLAALVAERPGLTVKDAGAEFGVDPTSLYRVVKQLETEGKLRKRGRELHPA